MQSSVSTLEVQTELGLIPNNSTDDQAIWPQNGDREDSNIHELNGTGCGAAKAKTRKKFDFDKFSLNQTEISLCCQKDVDVLLI